MIQHGVALMRLSGTQHGAGGVIEEFYVVVSDGNVLPKRYTTYAEAFKACDRWYTETHVDVA